MSETEPILYTSLSYLILNIKYLLKYFQPQRTRGCLPHNKAEELVWDANINIWSGEVEQSKKVEMTR